MIQQGCQGSHNDNLSWYLIQKSQQLDSAQTERQNLEEELREVQDKRDSVAHWEAQISEIIQW